MGLFDFMSSRTQSADNTTTNVVDSNNQTFSSTRVSGDQGNLSIQYGGGPSSDPMANLLPVLGAGLVVVGLVAYFNRNR
jgi:hypothetical protein